MLRRRPMPRKVSSSSSLDPPLVVHWLTVDLSYYFLMTLANDSLAKTVLITIACIALTEYNPAAVCVTFLTFYYVTTIARERYTRHLRCLANERILEGRGS